MCTADRMSVVPAVDHSGRSGSSAVRTIERPDALDYTLQGRATWLKSRSRDVYARAVSLFERAMTLDPGSIEAQSWLATELASRALDGLTETPTADIGRAEELAAQAVAASPRNQHAHFAKGQVLRAQRRPQEAIPEYEMVIALNRNHVNALRLSVGASSTPERSRR